MHPACREDPDDGVPQRHRLVVGEVPAQRFPLGPARGTGSGAAAARGREPIEDQFFQADGSIVIQIPAVCVIFKPTDRASVSRAATGSKKLNTPVTRRFVTSGLSLIKPA